MKKTSIILALLLVAVSSIFGLHSIYKTLSKEPENEQNILSKNNENDVSSKMNNERLKTEVAKSTAIEDYDYLIGQRLADSLLQQCSIFSGTIQSIESKESEQIKQVDFHIDNWLVGKRINNENDTKIVFSTWVSKKAGRDENLLENVNLEKGGRLLVASCDENNTLNTYKLVVSEEKYFPDIREVIKYNNSKVTKDGLLDVPQILKVQNNFVFAGYIIQYLWRLGITVNPNSSAIVLTELLGKDTIPKNAGGLVRGQLDYLLSGENDLLPTTRETITEKLVEMGSSKNKEEAEQAIYVLVSLSQKNKINISPFLRKENLSSLNQNYKTLVKEKVAPQERKKFEEQLIKN